MFVKSSASGSYWLEITNNSSTVTLKKLVGSTTTQLGSFTSTNDTQQRSLRLRRQGTTLQARIWLSSQQEPSTWNATVTDSAVTTAGVPKITFARSAGSNHTVTLDDLTYNDLSSPPTAVESVGYDADGRTTGELLPSGSRTWTYTSGRLTGLNETVPGLSRTTTVGYDTSGRIGGETTAGVTTTYGYDPADELTSVTPSTGSATSYTYDNRGRRATSTTGTSTNTYTYDDASQLTTLTPSTGPVTSFTYDQAGRRLTESASSGNTTYTYNQKGWLASLTRAGTTQARTYDGDGVLTSIANTTGSTTTTSSLDWDTTRGVRELVGIAGPAATTDLVRTAGAWAGQRQGATSTALAVDAYGSVLPSTGTSNIARASAYDAYGTASGAATFEPRLGYRGELTLDALVNLRVRDYQPTTGTFTTTDPVEGRDGAPTLSNPYH